MQMPTARTGETFVAEFREGNNEKLKLLYRYVEILENKLNEDDEFLIEHTNYGFKLLKPVDQDKDYMEAWQIMGGFYKKAFKCAKASCRRVELKHL